MSFNGLGLGHPRCTTITPATGGTVDLPVSPLFETLTTLMAHRKLLPRYSAQRCIPRASMLFGGDDRLSDSAKDAGMLTAVGPDRAGAAAHVRKPRRETALSMAAAAPRSRRRITHQALLSQPPGSLHKGLRVTNKAR